MLFNKNGLILSAIKVTSLVVVIDANVDKMLGILVHNAVGEDVINKFYREGLQFARLRRFVARSSDKDA